MLFESLKKKFNSNYITLIQKTAFGMDFGLWEVPKIDNDDDDYDDDDDEEEFDDDDNEYNVFFSSSS